MRHLAALLLSAGLALSFIQFQEEQRVPLRVSTPIIFSIGGHGHGTAVSLGGGLFLTAKHVIDAEEGRPLRLRVGDKDYDATFERDWADRDIALVRSELVLPAVPLRCDGAKVGDAITATGYPLNYGYMRMHGFVAGPIKWDAWMRIEDPESFHGRLKPVSFRALQWLDARIERGMSGGPVTDSENRLVGIQVITADTFAAAMVPAPALCEALDPKG